MASTGAVTWAELAREAVHAMHLDPERVLGVASAELNWVAPRPLQSVLRSGRGTLMPSLESALAYYFDALRADPRHAPIGSFMTRFRAPG